MEYRNLRRIDMGRNELAHLPSRLSDAHIAAGRQASETIRRLSAGVSSDLGKVRAVNEDNFLLIHLINEHSAPAVGHRCSQDLATDPWSCFAVFDGIGGLGNGELAAHSAAEIFRDIAAGLAPDSPHDEIDRKMRDGFSLAHQEVKRLRKAKCGTTGTMVCTNGRQFKVYHVGDCRAYLFRSGNLFQLTRDQTLSEMKMQRGIYRAGTPEQRSDSHVLTDYIGGTADFNLRPIESQWIPLRLGDKVLICSDGLYDMCPDQEMRQIIDEGGDIEHAVRSLTARALMNGGRDNVTCILVGAE